MKRKLTVLIILSFITEYSFGAEEIWNVRGGVLIDRGFLPQEFVVYGQVLMAFLGLNLIFNQIVSIFHRRIQIIPLVSKVSMSSYEGNHSQKN